MLAVLADGRFALRFALVFARLTFRAADARARVPAAFLAVVLRFVAAVRRLAVCVVVIVSAYPLHTHANARSSAHKGRAAAHRLAAVGGRDREMRLGFEKPDEKPGLEVGEADAGHEHMFA